MTAPARTTAARIQDTKHRLEHDVDCWVSTASASGEPYLVPLSFYWDGETILLSTAAKSPTSRNVLETGKMRLGFGLTRDVVTIEGDVDVLNTDDLAQETGDAFARATGFDPRDLTSPYLYFRVRPTRVQAWREVNELDSRTIMRNATWLA
jgi:hypothetical protein